MQKNLPKTTNKVAPTNNCDICGLPADNYDTQYYIHYCSLECFERFLKGYNREIDEIALEIKDAAELFEKKEDDVENEM